MSIRSYARPGFLEAPSYIPPDRSVCSIYLDLNECPFPPPDPVINAVSEAVRAANRYPDLRLYGEAEEAVARYAGVKPGYVMLTAGGDEALRAIFDVFVGSGDRVVLVEPGFAMNVVYAATHEAIVQKVRLVKDGRRFVLKSDEVIDASRGARLVIIENPNNPTGSLVADKHLVKALLEETEAIVVIDEAYYEFAGVTVVDLVNDYDRLFVVRTLSKAFCLAGLRIGYIIASPEAIELLRKAVTPFNLSIAQLVAAKTALEDPSYMRRVVEYVVAEREWLSRELAKLGLTVYESYTNFVLVETPVSNIHEKLRRIGVCVKPVKQLGLNFIRVTVGLHEENQAFVSALKRVLSG